MICRGHVPVWGAGQSRFRINGDIKKFIRFFIPKGAPLDRSAIGKAVRHLHLAFKNLETEEIYDVLMEQFLKAVKKYDPHYIDKVKLVVEKLDEVFPNAKSFTVADVDDYLEFSSDRYLRMLVRRGFLEAVFGTGKEKRITGFQRTATWPPPASLFEGGAIGLAYYIQTWFRYYLQARASKRSKSLAAAWASSNRFASSSSTPWYSTVSLPGSKFTPAGRSATMQFTASGPAGIRTAAARRCFSILTKCSLRRCFLCFSSSMSG